MKSKTPSTLHIEDVEIAEIIKAARILAIETDEFISDESFDFDRIEKAINDVNDLTYAYILKHGNPNAIENPQKLHALQAVSTDAQVRKR